MWSSSPITTQVAGWNYVPGTSLLDGKVGRKYPCGVKHESETRAIMLSRLRKPRLYLVELPTSGDRAAMRHDLVIDEKKSFYPASTTNSAPHNSIRYLAEPRGNFIIYALQNYII